VGTISNPWLQIGDGQMNLVWVPVGIWLLATNLSALALMGIDKSRAARGRRRVPEATFFRLCATGGAFGVLAASGLFHHKTSKDSFTSVALLAAIAWVLVLYGLQSLLGPPLP